jgi:hypothetical protein
MKALPSRKPRIMVAVNEEALRATLSRYFKTLAELAETVPDA